MSDRDNDDYSDLLTTDDVIQVCPFCDEPCLDMEPSEVIRAHGQRLVVHADCIEA